MKQGRPMRKADCGIFHGVAPWKIHEEISKKYSVHGVRHFVVVKKELSLRDTTRNHQGYENQENNRWPKEKIEETIEPWGPRGVCGSRHRTHQLTDSRSSFPMRGFVRESFSLIF